MQELKIGQADFFRALELGDGNPPFDPEASR
jgi:hypothetical protein